MPVNIGMDNESAETANIQCNWRTASKIVQNLWLWRGYIFQIWMVLVLLEWSFRLPQKRWTYTAMLTLLMEKMYACMPSCNWLPPTHLAGPNTLPPKQLHVTSFNISPIFSETRFRNLQSKRGKRRTEQNYQRLLQREKCALKKH